MIIIISCLFPTENFETQIQQDTLHFKHFHLSFLQIAQTNARISNISQNIGIGTSSNTQEETQQPKRDPENRETFEH